MIRSEQAGDEAAIDTFLAHHAETSMFLRSNLSRFGLFNREHTHATEFWLSGSEQIEAVFGISNTGFAMSQAPRVTAAHWDAFAAEVAGRQLAGITGETRQVDAAKRALRVEDADWALDAPEPLYRLPLANLNVPDQPGTIRKSVEADRDLIFSWARAYAAELHMSSPERLDEEAQGRTDRALETGDVRILEVNGQPVAMTAINARLPDMIQIGGVYTPRDLRGKGYARRVVALHLAEEREQGVASAILFASGPAACRAYEAIGFRHIGSYALAILKEPVILGVA
ncbi:GNAT family N-acetyltransferase [Aliiroseovarius sp. S1339]|uniref:GNAT family N-acetyltransferase n=1 Tax=Aliiroseovarius sp. S1339 TaxID=2936990 RepID=UPI0020C0DD51|nr:GNAT family N-acetyltransferase [Aliiroseovarius sp. S1339]